MFQKALDKENNLGRPGLHLPSGLGKKRGLGLIPPLVDRKEVQRNLLQREDAQLWRACSAGFKVHADALIFTVYSKLQAVDVRSKQRSAQLAAATDKATWASLICTKILLPSLLGYTFRGLVRNGPALPYVHRQATHPWTLTSDKEGRPWDYRSHNVQGNMMTGGPNSQGTLANGPKKEKSSTSGRDTGDRKVASLWSKTEKQDTKATSSYHQAKRLEIRSLRKGDTPHTPVLQDLSAAFLQGVTHIRVKN
ncbi:hypothetical protein BDK51DRAFT_31590 [Blyttiomyces helicus]|uniref:Uncharacterized protein n=1 Tax=Blyttiomyces helicus TaxID=388810 RepID=A0A4P9WEX5_9FUNG|nr:hypothetical protein BDK51DRAFT_31590 [Blyttiomyces helicus]|eukprot:RKO90273.1 hypothetical protein BDK51DRAFT_31590 [Blyttiomyces helicus]